MRKVRVAVVGATGLVGRTMLRSLEEREFPVSDIKLLASNRSAGNELIFRGEKIKVEELKEDSFNGIDIALFSAGSAASEKFAPCAAKSGCVVVDNGSFWRMNPNAPLIVPEVNADRIKEHKGIIANPNCSTIQLAVALKPILDNFGLKRVVVSTYQSITGAGQKGLDHLNAELEGRSPDNRVSPHQVSFNTFFHQIDDENGFSVEELKMQNEIKKIMEAEIPMAVTCVRLPIIGGHGESVNFETQKSTNKEEIREVLSAYSGICLMDDPTQDYYPTLTDAEGSSDVYVGRIREDKTVENGFYMWVVADNLRKGAASNAVQIAEEILRQEAFSFSAPENWF